MEDLINDFIAETREMLEALSGEIVAWEAEPQDHARLDAIFRFVHTVKGNCGFFDLPRLEALSHAAEGALADVRSGARRADQRLVSAVLGVLDRIGELIQELESGHSVATGDDGDFIAALGELSEAAVDPAHVAIPTADARRSLRSIRLPVDLLDRMMSSVSDMVLARNELSRSLRASSHSVEIEASFERVSACVGEMREAITRTRMQRIESLFAGLPRLVRDLAAELGKEVSLTVDGGDVELDREMIETIRDPITHIIRNAVDHGIEGAAERTAAGKPPIGSLRVSARQSGNQILIEIYDDGRGIDGERLVQRAVAAGIIPAEQAVRLTPAQKSALIFRPGLSTAAVVTGISGRGVGMDVVRANVERIGGVVDIESNAGQGLRLVLRVPLTLTIIPALTVGTCGQTYAIPRSAIEEIVRISGDKVRVETLGGSRLVTIRGKRLPLLLLSAVLGLKQQDAPDGSTIVVLKPAGGTAYGLAVDMVCDHEELVVKPAAPAVMATGLYAGTTLADSGKPTLLLDPSGIAARSGLALASAESDTAFDPAGGVDTQREEMPALLFIGIDGSRRAVPLSVIQRIEDIPAGAVKRSAGRLRVAVGDEILPLEGCGSNPPAEGFRALRMSDGTNSLAYALRVVVDIVSLGAEVLPSATLGEIGGVTLIDGEQVELLDPYWLFATCASAAAVRDGAPSCMFLSDDPWMQTILRPLVESAGYRVVPQGAAEAADADIAIASTDEQNAGLATCSAPVVRIRSKLEPDSETDDSIYRYDRAAFLGALSRHAAGRGA